jgi:hypothetical protein
VSDRVPRWTNLTCDAKRMTSAKGLVSAIPARYRVFRGGQTKKVGPPASLIYIFLTQSYDRHRSY